MLQFPHRFSEQRTTYCLTEKGTSNSLDRALEQFIIHQQFLQARQQWEKTEMFFFLFEVKAWSEENKRGPKQVFANTPTQPCVAGEDKGKLQ